MRRLILMLSIIGAGVATRAMLYSQTDLQVGYATATAAAGSRAPVGSALFTFSDSSGDVISEAGVGAAEPTLRGRVYVDEAGVQTGIAFANPGNSAATILLTLRDLAGNEVGRRTLTLGSREHYPRYVSELFAGRPPSFSGTLTFESDRPVAAVTLRESRTARSEPLYATLPVVDLAAAAGTQLVFPHIAVGEGYTTQIILINRTSQVTRGRVRLFNPDGAALLARVGSSAVSEISYRVEANGAYRVDLESVAGLLVGFATVTGEGADVLPSGTAIFQFRKSGALVSEAGVLSAPTSTAVRIFVDHLGTRTGVAIANPGVRETEVTVDLMDRYGGRQATTTRVLPANGHLAMFTEELFPSYGEGFSGLLEIRSPQPIAAVTLKVTVNRRGDVVLTTLPVADLTRSLTAASLVFPHIAIGNGFSTRLIFINPDSQSANTGRLNFYKSDGAAMSVPLQGRTTSEAGYSLVAGSARRFLPGNSLSIGSISLRAATSAEIVINEGNVLRPQLRILDTSSQGRDDFDVSYNSLDPEIATVDETGAIQGKRAGFSTLTISSAAYVTTATITVVKVDSGVSGFRINGIAQDLAQRLYMAATSEHTVLLAEDLKQRPEVYAGIRATPGFKDDARLQSQFRDPAFLAFNQAEGTLYVSDSANNVIRKVQPGADGQVETLGGRFNNPQGIALDNRGNLWIADSGTHTIRRLQITTGAVETIAGKAGTAGAADGRGEAAQFNSPRGIAIETDTLAQQLERERRGEPPPPVSVIVADSGNGLLRRVKETGEVETIRAAAAGAPVRSFLAGKSAAASDPIRFNSPTGVAIDPFGNIFVTESATADVKVVLQNGEVTSGAQPNTLQNPGGVVAQAGRVVVAQTTVSAVEISYGVPQIRSITPEHLSARGGATVTITGNNFGPDALVFVGGTIISRLTRPNTTDAITFVAPPLPSGRTTVTVQTRGGMAQAALLVDVIPLSALPPGYISTFAGGSTFSGDGLQARSARLSNPGQIAIDPAGNVYIADAFDNRIRRVAAITGLMNTIAGDGQRQFTGDSFSALSASFDSPKGVAVDAEGNIYIADTGASRIRKVSARTGIITTIAGNGRFGASGDGGSALAASLASPLHIAVDKDGNVYITDSINHLVRKLTIATGIISSIAGTRERGFSGDDGPAAGAMLNGPSSVAVDRAGNVFIADTDNNRVRRIDARTGVIRTIAGNGELRFAGDNRPATATSIWRPLSITLDSAGNVFMADTNNNRIRKVSATTGIMTTVAGNGLQDLSGDNGPAVSASVYQPTSVGVDGAGNLFIVEIGLNRIREVDARTGIIHNFAGGAGLLGDNGPATAATLGYPNAIAFDSEGNLVIGDAFNSRVRRVAAGTSVITTIAGGPFNPNAFAESGPATSTNVYLPRGIALDSSGNIYIADTSLNRIFMLDPRIGFLSTVVGGGGRFGIPGYSGDGGTPFTARVNQAEALAVDRTGNLIIADTANHRIRMVDFQRGIITTIAGNGQAAYSGDNGPAISASINRPSGVTVGPDGSIFVADQANSRVRKIDPVSGIITTVAGSGSTAFTTKNGRRTDDNGPAILATVAGPTAVTTDAGGNLYICSFSDVRKVDAATGIITTVAGKISSSTRFFGDGGVATDAGLWGAHGLAFDAAGNLYISDSFNNRIRVIRGPLP